jgi:uncharacterized protein YkwD
MTPQPTEEQEAMGRYYRGHPQQSLRSLSWDSRLMAAAQWKAEYMALANFCSHETPSGIWPNKMVRMEGYDLPDWYADDSNQVESLACGPRTYQEAIDLLFSSSHHHNHMAGVGFWSDHVRYGVGHGHNENSKYNHYWVVVTAPLLRDVYWQWLPVISKSVTLTKGQ